MVLARCCSSNTNLRLSGGVDTSLDLSFSVLIFSRTVSVDCTPSLSCGVHSVNLRCSGADVGLTRCQQTDFLQRPIIASA